MKTLHECIQEATQKGVAIGHFNISTIDAAWAIVKAAEKLNVPVIIGVSEGERDFVGVREIARVVASMREHSKVPVFLNADHTYSKERVLEAIDAGFDSVIIDGAQLSMKENIALTKETVLEAKKKNPQAIVEAELGYIGTSSKLLTEIPEGASMGANLTTVEDAKTFVTETGIDMFAPAVGNVHGMLVGMPNPHLDIQRIKDIAQALPNTPLVLHGGSGIPDEDFTAAIGAGIRIIHINTEIRLAYTKALSLELQKYPDEVAPYKYLKVAAAALQKVVEERLALFNKM